MLLASRSPERRRLLREAGFEVEVEPQDVEEEAARKPQDVHFTVIVNAVRKAKAAAARHPRSVVVAADTLVYDSEGVYGKPASPEEARAMLEHFSGRTVHVATGLALAVHGAIRCVVDRAQVKFRSYGPEEVEAYVASGEPLGKAGAFTIRGRGSLLVESVSGHPSTILGLPLHRLVELLRGAGVYPGYSSATSYHLSTFTAE